MKKIVKLLIGCLVLLLMLCVISAVIAFLFWNRIRDFVSPYISKGNSENISVNYVRKIDKNFKLKAIL
jgi:hypothetical protein